jgi:hypothetical protein
MTAHRNKNAGLAKNRKHSLASLGGRITPTINTDIDRFIGILIFIFAINPWIIRIQGVGRDRSVWMVVAAASILDFIFKPVHIIFINPYVRMPVARVGALSSST